MKTKKWFNKQNQLHRLDGPAVEWVNGDEEWWVNGQRHREDGPAIEEIDGEYQEWWINDTTYLSEKAYWLKIYEMKLITKEELFLKLL